MDVVDNLAVQNIVQAWRSMRTAPPYALYSKYFFPMWIRVHP
jgi:hypothetical protein